MLKLDYLLHRVEDWVHPISSFPLYGIVLIVIIFHVPYLTTVFCNVVFFIYLSGVFFYLRSTNQLVFFNE